MGSHLHPSVYETKNTFLIPYVGTSSKEEVVTRIPIHSKQETSQSSVSVEGFISDAAKSLE